MRPTRFDNPEHTRVLASPSWSRCEGFIKAFEEAWRRGPAPVIADFLREDGPLRRALLVELVHVDLEFRVKSGESVRVETYLESYPELAENRPVTLDLIAAEYELRRRMGGDVSLDEYRLRFPEYLEDLLSRLPPGGGDTPDLSGKGPPTVVAGRPAVPGYELLEEIGRGGMGVVYQALDPLLGRHVALKFLPGEYARDPDRLERFLREARTASALNHPNICTVHALGEHEGRPFIVMEFIEGVTLHELAARRPGVAEVVRLIGQAARALAAAHAAGVVHRDIKPENVMARADGYVKVLDFGLARRLPTLARPGVVGPDTDPGAIIGTVAYMSPEQARGGAADSASDIFSLGIVLYQLTTGRHPFESDSALGTMYAITARQPLPVSRINPEVPAALEGLVGAMLHKDARLRPTAAEVEAALAALEDAATAGPARIAPRPIVHREPELAALRAALAEAEAGRGSVVCVSGEPGIGKTTLVEDFLDELTALGRPCLVARGHCSERLAGTEAYLPVIDALEDLLRGEPSGSVARLMKVVAPTWYAQVTPAGVRGPGSGVRSQETGVRSQETEKKETPGASLTPDSCLPTPPVVAGSPDPATPRDRRSPELQEETFGRPGGPVRRPGHNEGSGGRSQETEKKETPGASLTPDSCLPTSDCCSLAPPERAASRQAMLREFCGLLQEASRLGPVVLFFDDVHWADVSTVDLLAHLGHHCRGLRVLTVVTYRPTELLLGPHPFHRVRLELQGKGVCAELSLGFLGRGDIDRYLALAFPGHALPADFADLIHSRTEGSPLFMADLLRYLRERGVIAEAGEGWTLARPLPDLRQELPESVRSMIQRKLERLDEGDRRLLTAASVQGHEFDSAVAAAALNRDAAEVEERLQAMDRIHGLVRLVRESEFPDGTLTLRYAFVHVLYQQALYNDLQPTRRAALSAALARALEDRHGEESTEAAAELACLYQVGRDFGRAARQLCLAAQNDASVFAHKEAVVLARRGLRLLGQLPDTPERAALELPLQTTLGLQLQVTEGFAAPEAGRAYSRARELCQQAPESPPQFPVLWGHRVVAGSPDPRVVAGSPDPATSADRRSPLPETGRPSVEAGGPVRRPGHNEPQAPGSPPQFPVLWGLWLYSKVRSELTRATELAEELRALAQQLNEPALMLQVQQALAVTSLCRGEPSATLRHMEQGAALYDPDRHRTHSFLFGQDPGVACKAFGAVALWLLGYPEEARRQSAEAVLLSHELSQPSSQSLALHFAAMLHQLCRDGPSARACAEACAAFAGEHGFSFWLAGALVMGGWAQAACGEVPEGIDQLRQGLLDWTATGSVTYQTYYLGLLAEVLLDQGQTEEAGRILEDALALVGKTGEGLYEAELYRLRGELLLRGPDDSGEAALRRAEEDFRRALDVARRQEARSLTLRAAMSLARLGHRLGKADEVRPLLAAAHDWFTEGFQTPDLREARALLDGLT